MEMNLKAITNDNYGKRGAGNMRYSCKNFIEYDLKQHYKLLKEYEEEINSRSEYKGFVLKKANSKNGIHYYSAKSPDSSGYLYLGPDTNEVVIGIREYAFYEKSIERIRINISALEDLLAVYRKTSADNINDLLRPVYRLPSNSRLLIDEPMIDDWLAKCHDKKNRYPIHDPESLIATAYDGTQMRSRAETTIYETFYIYDIPAIFELPYTIGNDTLRPDFTILDVLRMQEMIWEHLGNWFHSDPYKSDRYRKDSMHRWDQYGELGFYPEHNLILTFGLPNNRFDVSALARKISMIAMPPPSKETIELLMHA